MGATVKKSKTHPGIIILIIFIAMVIGAVGICMVFLQDYTGIKLSNDVTIEIKEGWGANKISEYLKDEGVIKYPHLFRFASNKGGYDSEFKPGIAVLSDGMSYEDILKTLTQSDRDTIKITIPEGYEIRQIADVLYENGLIDKDKFYEELSADKYNYRFLEDIPNRENQLEGYLFPATYDIKKGMSEHDIIDMMLKAFNDNFKDEYYEKAQSMNMSVDDIVTLASIIERETNTDNDRKKVAGVFYNRLSINMRLQSCATIQYILKERKTKLTVADTKIESPYNTYMNSGLPIGPIASPGISCIDAALYPEQTDALYFVLGSDGKHIFSKTYEEHLKAKQNGAKDNVEVE